MVKPLRIVYYGHYKDGTGWANAAVGYIESLMAANVAAGSPHEILTIPCRLNGNNIPLPQHLQGLECHRLPVTDKPTVLIQHTLPHLMNRIEGVDKHIGLAVFETDSFTYTNWTEKLNLMDQVWVPCRDNVKTCTNSYVMWDKIKIVPHAFDMDKNLAVYEKLSKKRFVGGGVDGDYLFYTISEFSKRKNFEALLKAYFIEFDPAEPVSFLIKTSGDIQKIAAMIEGVKKSLKLYKDLESYQDIPVIHYRVNDEELIQLHKNCDCYVNASRGEAWSIPTFQAYALGKQVLSASVGGTCDFLTDENMVGVHADCCNSALDTLPNIYTGRELWQEVDITSLRHKMRHAYTNQNRFRKTKHDKLSKYGYESVGGLMLEYASEGFNV